MQRFSTPYYSASSSGMSIVLSEEESILSAASPSTSARLGCCRNPPQNCPRSGPEGPPPLAEAAHAGGGEAGAALGRGVRHALHPRHDGPRPPRHHRRAHHHQALLAAHRHHRRVSLPSHSYNPAPCSPPGCAACWCAAAASIWACTPCWTSWRGSCWPLPSSSCSSAAR